MSKTKPTLLIMAAGLGSRYGGLKQMDPMDDEGNVIIDYSMYDAYRAGFRRVIFVIKEENKDDFEEVIGNRARRHFEVHYAFQKLDDLPEGFAVPEGRTKPWGTAHAVFSARDLIDGPFAVINADDYYGVTAFKQIYDYLESHEDNDKYSYVMVGYKLKNTVSEQGHVARGVCEVENGKLKFVTERTRIEIKDDGKIAFSEDDGANWTELPEETIVSMNMWGFTKSYMDEIGKDFPAFLRDNLTKNPLKCEYFVPFVVGDLLEKDICEVTVLTSVDKWYGVTYKEDKPVVMEAFKNMKANGTYPHKLWEA